MHNKKEICDKIIFQYPDLGECGINVGVEYDKKNKACVVSLKKDTHELKHFLEPTDADLCIEGKQCVALGLEISQLRKNIGGKQY